MTDETSELVSKSTEKNVRHRGKKEKQTSNPVLPKSGIFSSRQSIIQWLTSYFRYKSQDKIDVSSSNENKKQRRGRSILRSCICTNLLCKLILFFCTIYLIMFLRPDYSIYIRNSFENIMKKFNLTSEEFQLRPGQRLSHYRQPSMPIIIIPGIISTGLELWQGTQCASGKFLHRFWTSMQMVGNIGRDHQCWLKHISLNLSTWYEDKDKVHPKLLFRDGQSGPGTGTKFLFGRDQDRNFFDWDRHQKFFLKGPGPRPKTFSRRDRDQNFFVAGTGTKNDWSRSCLLLFLLSIYRKDPESVRLRPVLGWAAADYVYVIKLFISIDVICLWDF